jgi:hypothetical protein
LLLRSKGEAGGRDRLGGMAEGGRTGWCSEQYAAVCGYMRLYAYQNL